MIWLDIPLGITAVLFLVLSSLYGWGLLQFFRYNFRWSYASVIGIMTVVSTTGTLVWYLRYGALAWELIWSLAVVFSAALPGMIWVDRVMRRDRWQQKRELKQLREEIREQRALLLSQEEMINSFERIISKHDERSEKRIVELASILEMRDRARSILREHLSRIN